MNSKTCPFCKESKPAEKFRKTKWGGRLTKCNQCRYDDFKKSKAHKYVSLSERDKLKTSRAEIAR